ncbi:Type III restriction enzyme, res subunit [Bifidobacterium margollesii]|uniref:Type III restriction enzyme, res subunit n=1 Tax=Bifidobacterium margollesii TaxID=2020964 RepID=A0A2N5JCM2_9BIFI|nr:DEAD/DEAH box helicase family protein [Bifidobacterium margollesii]PLS31960.1 Type III restriction enzyme, res subunit [Bifidobacterium margollesii]
MGSGNCDFVKDVFPEIYEDCAKAESYIFSDPVIACVYARRAIDWLTGYLYYDVFGLYAPYHDDISSRIHNPQFMRSVNDTIVRDFDAVRVIGNKAAHEEQPNIDTRRALMVVGNLFHVVIWSGFHHSSQPNKVPVSRRFDSALASKSTALNARQAAQVRQRANEQIAEHRRIIEERERLIKAKDEAIAEQQAELERLREQIRQAQAAVRIPDTHDYTIGEAETRAVLIDELLAEQGWKIDDHNREVKITGLPKTAQHPSGIGFADYVLWDDDGLPLAVVEAKRTMVNAEAGLMQAREYADGLERMTGQRPVIFATNGDDTKIWDNWQTPDGREAGYPERTVHGFYRKEELRRLIQRRTGAHRLSDEPINTTIAGRPYQISAIANVDAAFDARQRGALLVMATGTGKTRVTIALVDQLMKAGWVRNVLFLADRTALVNQAARAFRNPDTGLGASVPIVNLLEDDPETAGRIYLSTYPTMMNLVNARRNGDAGELKFGPGFFDLVIIDEAHRSVYAKYGFLFEYFDSLLVGLTATPKNEVDRNTYRLFNLEYDPRTGGVPTAAYSLDEAVHDGYLVPSTGRNIVTKFIRDGITYDQLSDEEKLEWEEKDWNEDGEVPDAVSAGDVNRFLFNADTIDKVLGVVMRDGIKVDDGDTIGKTIIFARNQRHAEAIKHRFDIGWPEYGGSFAQIITHSTRSAQDRIDDFSDPAKLPQIAISVDMLDTGVDVPEVVNLVLFKPVMSSTKYWQMIGRGTRLCPDLFGPAGEPGSAKTGFMVFDCCGNLEFFRHHMPEASGKISMPLGERLFRLRVGLVEALDAGAAAGTGSGAVAADGSAADGDDPSADELKAYRASLVRQLGGYVAGMDARNNVLVRPHRRLIEEINGGGSSDHSADGSADGSGDRSADRDWWHTLTEDKAREVVTLAGLPSNIALDDDGTGAGEVLSSAARIPARRFDELMYRYELAVLQTRNEQDGNETGVDAAEIVGLPARSLRSVKAAVQLIAADLMSPKNRNLPTVQAQADLLEAVAGEDWWEDVTVPMLEQARKSLRGIAHYAAESRRNVVYTDFEDTIEVTDVDVTGDGNADNVDYERFRERALAFLRSEENNITLRRVRMGRQLTQQDLDELGRMLIENGVGDERNIEEADARFRDEFKLGDGAADGDAADGDAAGAAADEVRGFGLFIRSLVGLDAAAVQAAFSRFLDGKRYAARQIDFVKHIIDELTEKGVMKADRLYQSPFIDLSASGPEGLFVDSDLDDLFDILDGIKRSAIPLQKAA